MSIRSDPFEHVLQVFSAGQMVIMLDDEQRENEGDLVVATERVTTEQLAFMMRVARGLVCVSISDELATRLNLPLQTADNNSLFQTPFAVSIDHTDVAGHGITASSRAFTLSRLLSPDARPEEFVSPGHVFPLIASPAGVLGRRGQTEGSFDLARLAGFSSSGVICEVLNPDGSMARGPDLEAFAARHGLKLTSVQDVARYRIASEVLVRSIMESELRTSNGSFRVLVFADDVEGKEHLALIRGEVEGADHPLVRIHSECLTGDVFGSRKCDCGAQLSQSLQAIAQAGCGVLLYLRQEGRGIGLANKLRAYALQEQGHDTVEANVQLGFAADQRDYEVAAKILKSLGVRRVRLLTNNPKKLQALERSGISVTDRVPLVVTADEFSQSYLDTKRQKMGHLL